MTHTNSIIAALLIIPLLFLDSTLAMVDVWLVNETFTHGFLIFPIAIWLLWQKRSRLNRITANPQPRALLLIIPLLAIWLVGFIGDVNAVQQLAVISLIPSTIFLLFGWKLFAAAAFPLFYLYFAIPLGQGLIPPLMEFTAYFTVQMIQLVGIPVYQDGLYFILPSGNWSVVEECSGVRYLIASMALGTIYAYLTYQSTRRRTIFILFSIAVPIIANGLRAFMIVMIGHYSGMKYAVGADHLLYGWVFFGLVIFIMFYIGSFWGEQDTETDDDAKATTDAIGHSNTTRTPTTLLLILSVTILTTRTYAYYLAAPADIPDDARFSLSMSSTDWSLTATPDFNWSPDFNNPDKHLTAAFQHNNEIVRIDVAFFAYQRNNAEAISSLNRLTNPYEGDWKIIDSRMIQRNGMDIRQTELLKMDRKVLVWNWYRVGRFETANPYMAKLYQVYNQLFLDRKDVSMVAISTSFDQNIDITTATLERFTPSFRPALNQMLEKVISDSP